MDDELDTVAFAVRADRTEFMRDVADMRGALSQSLTAGADVAARGIENALSRAARSGRLEFEDLAKVAGRALGEIAGAALKLDGGSLLSLGGSAAGLLGLPGRATGGPVSGGKAYVVGERGPELFVPTSSGRVEPGGVGRSVNVTVNVMTNNSAGAAAGGGAFMAETGRQVARQVRRVLERS